MKRATWLTSGVALAALVSLAPVASAQSPSNEDLLARIEKLEAQNAALMSRLDRMLDEDDIDRRDLIHKITVIAQGAKDLDSEHGCFARVRVELERLTGRSVDGDEDLAMRKEARLLVAKEQSPKQSLMQRNATKPLEARRPSPRLLDVEVVAIYW